MIVVTFPPLRPYAPLLVALLIFSGALLRELRDLIDIRLIDESRASQDWATAADDIAVNFVEPQQIDKLITFDEGLLINGPLQLAFLDERHGAWRKIECSDLCFAIGHADGSERCRCERCAECHDITNGRILLKLRNDTVKGKSPCHSRSHTGRRDFP